jgi:DNA mismatch repair protein MutS
MLDQYLSAKAECPDALLMFRMGDFFELFFEDAKLVARELGITLTSRDKGAAPVPMAGVPHHAVSRYIAQLLGRGHSVALCDQVEDPKQAKGLVKRQITRIITPGTLVDLEALEPGRCNYLAATVAGPEPQRVLALLDLLSGEILVTQVEADRLGEELQRMNVRELLTDADSPDELQQGVGKDSPIALRCMSLESVDDHGIRRALERRFGVDLIAAWPGGGTAAQRRAVHLLISYAEQTQRRCLSHLEPPRAYRAADSVVLDAATWTNLELETRSQDGSRHGSLLWHLDETLCPMGARLLRRWMAFPLRQAAAIAARADAVQCLKEQRSRRQAIQAAFAGVRDLERLMGRVAMQRATPRDLAALRDSLLCVPPMRQEMKELLAASAAEAAAVPVSPGAGPLGGWQTLSFASIDGLAQELDRALVPQPPVAHADGGIFAAGYCPELDELLALSQEGHGFLTELEQRERQRTGISSLKVRFNRVFGYYLEVTRANLNQVPADYVRKQTLVNAERYITEELKTFEDKVLHAEERRKAREATLFTDLCAKVLAQLLPLRALARLLAQTDASASLAEVADRYRYVRPEISEAPELWLEEARHPVIERLLPNGETFVPNDLQLGGQNGTGPQFMLVTGPNMAGKSTVMRQAALCVLLAHMGSFVPARRARIGLCDRLFTRVGAGDNLTRGHSTFMVEMMETATILRQATAASFVLLDEIGRGTSTYDGLAIATAVAEYLHDEVGCRTLFSTHYHEMCDLAGRHPRMVNTQMAVRHTDDKLVFLRRLVAGSADKSYGIDVARLAGLPAAVLDRAAAVLATMAAQPKLPGASAQAASATAEASAVQASSPAPAPALPVAAAPAVAHRPFVQLQLV